MIDELSGMPDNARVFVALGNQDRSVSLDRVETDYNMNPHDPKGETLDIVLFPLSRNSGENPSQS